MAAGSGDRRENVTSGETLDWCTFSNPTLELALDGIRARDPLPVEVQEQLYSRHGREQNAQFLERFERQRTTQVRDPWYQRALEIHSELEEKVPGMLERSRVRHAIANYIRTEVVPWAHGTGREHKKDRHDWLDYILLAQKLEDARPAAVYGLDVLEERSWVQWANRAGLVKLCPDDARGEQARIAKIYGERLKWHDEAGHVIRSAVFTMPNFPQWHLAAGVDAIFKRFRDEILYARTDGTRAKSLRDPRRRFPDIVGAWACLEAPLSGRHVDGDRTASWNVHLNVILVFKRTDELTSTRVVNGMTLPDYEPIIDAWGAGVRFHSLPSGDHDAIQAALRELVKYPVQAISSKSAAERKKKRDSQGRELTPAPPMIEWPAECFDEWWRAHHGLRRIRSWGCLYSHAIEIDGERHELPDIDAPRSPAHFLEPIGSIKLSPSRCVVSWPMPDTREIDRKQQIAERARARGLHLIQGNKSAGVDALEKATGPPN